MIFWSDLLNHLIFIKNKVNPIKFIGFVWCGWYQILKKPTSTSCTLQPKVLLRLLYDSNCMDNKVLKLLLFSLMLRDGRVLNQLRICHRECFPTRLGWGIRKLIFSFELSTTDRNSFIITLAWKGAGRNSQSHDKACEGPLWLQNLGEKICVFHSCYKRYQFLCKSWFYKFLRKSVRQGWADYCQAQKSYVLLILSIGITYIYAFWCFWYERAAFQRSSFGR